MPFIRYFGILTPVPDGGPGDLAYNYFTALHKTGIPVRVLAANLADFTDAPINRWDKFSANLILPIPKFYTNVVCGDSDLLSRVITLGVPNVAIINGDTATTILKDYDAVICPTAELANTLRDVGIKAFHVFADPSELHEFLKLCTFFT